ncbi:MAG: chromate efflux transporter [Desulfobacteraceae bacterium]|nr:chromate efflux transporter [Desulfobacteraceae bacterium]
MEMVQSCEGRCAPSSSRLFLAFLRMGITGFGGPAMIAYFRKMAVGEKKWIESEPFRDGVALCQTIPGATAMQMAAYIGLRVRGVRGAICCYAGFGLPAFVLMLALSAAYSEAHALPAVVSVFSGLQAVIVSVVANATISFGKSTLKDWRRVLIALVAAGLFWLMTNPTLIILAAALLGMLLNARQPVPPGVRRSDDLRLTTVPLLLFAFGFACVLVLLFFLRNDLFDLALLMSKVDVMAFGGGFASVPLLFHEVVEIRSWMDASTFLNGIVLGQFTPGPIVITATFIGYMAHGPVGALVATIAIFLPSFLILIGTAPWFDRARSSPWVTRAVAGILCSFVGLLLTVTVRFALNVQHDWSHFALAAASLAALLFKVDILWVVLAGTAVSVLAF